MSCLEAQVMPREQLEEEARLLGYVVESDDTDTDLVSVIVERSQRKTA